MSRPSLQGLKMQSPPCRHESVSSRQIPMQSPSSLQPIGEVRNVIRLFISTLDALLA